MSDHSDLKSITGGLNARQLREELGLAFSLLTRFPVPEFELKTAASLSSSFWAYPLVGVVVGFVGAVVLALLSVAGLGAIPSVLFALASMALVTGALHEDGFADLCDGIGGGVDLNHTLEIMRDSRLGTYGVLGLILAVGLEAVLLIEVIAAAGTYPALFVLIATASASRMAIAVPAALLAPARQDGMGGRVEKVPARLLIAVVGLAVLVGVVCTGWGAAAIIIGAICGALMVTALAHRHLEGYTGDVLGATVVVSKITALTLYLLLVLGP